MRDLFPSGKSLEFHKGNKVSPGWEGPRPSTPSQRTTGRQESPWKAYRARRDRLNKDLELTHSGELLILVGWPRSCRVIRCRPTPRVKCKGKQQAAGLEEVRAVASTTRGSWRPNSWRMILHTTKGLLFLRSVTDNPSRLVSIVNPHYYSPISRSPSAPCYRSRYGGSESALSVTG